MSLSKFLINNIYTKKEFFQFIEIAFWVVTGTKFTEKSYLSPE